MEYLPVNDLTTGDASANIMDGRLSVWCGNKKTINEQRHYELEHKNWHIMPCFVVIAKDAYGSEGKMWEVEGIVKNAHHLFQALLTTATGAGQGAKRLSRLNRWRRKG